MGHYVENSNCIDGRLYFCATRVQGVGLATVLGVFPCDVLGCPVRRPVHLDEVVRNVLLTLTIAELVYKVRGVPSEEVAAHEHKNRVLLALSERPQR